MKKAIKILTTGVVTVSLAISGATAAGASSATTASKGRGVSVAQSGRFTGEELFRGVVFGQGGAGHALGNLTASVDLSPEVVREIDVIVAEVQAQAPSFFDQFAAMAQSGDVMKVERAFTELGTVLDAALEHLGYRADVNTRDVSPACIQVVLFAVGALVYAGVAILQVAAVAVSVLYASPRDAQPALSHEKWIAEATVRLGH